MSNFSDKLWSEIRKEFGIHCIRQRDIKKAKQYFEESLAVDAAKLDSVFHLTNAQAKVANTEHALRLLNQVSVAQPGLCVLKRERALGFRLSAQSPNTLILQFN